ncbi:hypothetical protein AC579_10092 [Pseudocercospora musae]|uniref:Uncharacterized protein n=1 Tax=Pseudocercospora musae TaxID=113226 RepID=A0A139IGB6_9PEZI|nr:hypothetical protein AC579_10092 [Pseudocercospora musae]
MPLSIDKALVDIEAAMNQNAPIEIVVSAFPFKSPNHQDKVLGTLPDEAERVSLKHLDSFCKSICSRFRTSYNGRYRIPAYCIVVAHNISDLLEVSDETVWDYGQALREMAIEQECQSLQFVRMADLLHGADEKTTLTKLEYVPGESWHLQGLA